MAPRARVSTLSAATLFVLAVVAGGTGLQAQLGRDLAGFYDVANPFDGGTNIWFRLTVEI